MDKKYCSGCQSNRCVDFFTEPYKNCDKCREKGRKNWHRQTVEQRGEANERKKKWTESEKGKATIQANRQKVHYCELCDYEVKKEKKSQHEKSLNHQYFLQKSLNGEKLERPDEKELKNGVLWFRCLKCKKKEIYYAWCDHVSSERHINNCCETV